MNLPEKCSLERSSRGRGWLITAALIGAACSGSSSPAPKPLGSMPEASTTAVPQWLPERVLAGAAVPDDAREKHLFDTRRLTFGWSVKQVLWTPDGASIVMLATPPGAPTPGVFKVSIERAATEPTRISRPEDAVTTMAITPRSRQGGSEPWKLLYATAGSSSLTELDSSTAATRSVQVGELIVDGLTVSAKGPLYFVAHDTKANTALYTAPRLGDPAVALASDEVAAVGPALSPDDAYLAFGKKRRAAGAGAVAWSSVEGRSVVELTSVAGDYAVRNMTFHPSGQWLVFASDRDRRDFDLYAIDVKDTTREPRLERLTYSRADSPAFSHDGRSLAFTSQREGPSRDLYVARFIEEP